MKKSLAFLLSLLCLFLAAGCGAAPELSTAAPEKAEAETTAAETTAALEPCRVYSKTTDFAIVDGYDSPATTKTTHAMQGMTLSDGYLYCVKVNGTNDKGVIYRVDTSTAEVVRMTSGGEEYVNFLYHGNDLTAVEYEGKTFLLVSTMKTGLGSILQLEVNGTEYQSEKTYNTVMKGEDIKLSGIDVLKQEGSQLTLLVKSYAGPVFTLYTCELDLTDPKTDLELTQRFTFDHTLCFTGEKEEKLASWVHQSIYVHNGRLYMPITEYKKSYLIQIDLYGADGSLISGEAEEARDSVFMLTSDASYSSFEVEGVVIAEDGTMFVNSNRKENGIYKNDGIHTVDGFKFGK